MSALSGRPMFLVGTTTYVWEDVVLTAVLAGDWTALEQEVRDGLACMHRLDEIEEEVPLENEVTTTATEFRYERDLVAAEDMEAWLERRGLTAEDWMDFIQRSVLRRRWAKDLEAIREEYPVEHEEVEEAILCEAICGGRAAAWASQLAARAAAYAKLMEEGAGAGDGISADEVQSVPASLTATRDDLALPGLAGAGEPERCASLARLEAAWRHFAARQVTPQAIREQLANHRLDWTRLRVQAVCLEDFDAAREVALCIRVDGRDPAEVATEAGADLEEGDWYLDEVDPALQDPLRGARGGEVLGPLRVQERFVVLAVLAKQPPAADDPALVARAERLLRERAVNREVESRVRWHQSL